MSASTSSGTHALTKDNLKAAALHSESEDANDADLTHSTSSFGRTRSLSVASMHSETSEGERPSAAVDDDELLAAVDSLFFDTQNDAKLTRHTLTKLAAQGDNADISALVREQQRALEIVNSRLAERVMSNYSLFVHGMAKIHEIGLDLQQSAVMCKNGRRLLAQTKQALTTHGLVIRAKHRKRELYRGIAADLNEIQLILSNERHIRDAVDEGDFPRAIELCVACHASLRAYEQFTCLSAFNSYVQSSWEALNRRVESAVRDVVRKFDPLTYERVLIAYRRMDRGFHVLERLQRQFIDTINEDTKNALYAHVLQSERNAMRAEELKAMNFKNLSDALEDRFFVDCLHTILEYLTEMFYVHWQMTKWHERRAVADAAAEAANGTADDEDTDGKFLANVHDVLLRFRKTMWDKMQRKVAAILSTSQLSNYKIDDFLHVLDSVYRFIAIGEAFSGCDSDHMRRSIKQQSKQYFVNMHKARMEDLSIMLLNEQWHPCPVADDFELDHIKEFMPPAPSSLAGSNIDGTHDADQIFNEHAKSGNPFSKAVMEATAAAASKARRAPQAPTNVASAAVASASASASDPEATDESEKRHFMTSTCISVAKYIGKYIQMMQILEPISYQIFVGLEQLYNFYLFAVHKFFIESIVVPASLSEMPQLQPKALPAELRNVIAAVLAKLEELGPFGQGLLPRLDESVAARLADANGLYGAAKRTVALESLVELAQATKRQQARLSQLLAGRPGADKTLREFLASSVSGAVALRRHGYVLLSSIVLPFENLCKLVENTNWATTKSVETQYNAYVDRYKEEYRLFAVRLQTLQQQGGIPRAVYTMLWRQAIARGMDTLIEGYARAKKCTDQGQTLRKLDLQEFCSELNSLAPKTIGRPLPRHEDVALYIRAYYHDPDMFLPFVKENNEKFTQKQLLSIINQGFGKDMKKQLKKDLEKVIEEIYLRQEAVMASTAAAAAIAASTHTNGTAATPKAATASAATTPALAPAPKVAPPTAPASTTTHAASAAPASTTPAATPGPAAAAAKPAPSATATPAANATATPAVATPATTAAPAATTAPKAATAATPAAAPAASVPAPAAGASSVKPTK